MFSAFFAMLATVLVVVMVVALSDKGCYDSQGLGVCIAVFLPILAAIYIMYLLI